jgi:hypothetical protein
MTLTFPITDVRIPRLDYNQRCIRYTHKLFKRLSLKCYGKNAGHDPSKRIHHITYFEDKTKSGDPTAFHAHSLIIISHENRQRFEKTVEKQWLKIVKLLRATRKPKPAYIEDLDNIGGFVNYITKQANNDYEFIWELPLTG